MSSTSSSDPLAEWAGVIDAAIFAALHTNATELTWNCALGLGLEGIVLGAILTQVYRYFEHFHRRDSRLTLCMVALGTAGCLGQFGINLWQTYLFIDKASSAVYLVLEKDVYADMVVLIMIGLYNLGAAIYFSRRAIKLVGNASFIAVPLVVLCIASFAMCIATVCNGFRLPTDTTTLNTWLSTVNKYVIAWTALSLVTDTCVCGLMTYALIKSRQDIKAAATSLLRKLLMLTFETMLPPLIAVLIMLIYGCSATATLGNFSRALGWVIGPLYFHAILHSLVGRHDVSSILEHQSRDPILGAPQHAGANRRDSRVVPTKPFSEGVLPLHRAWSSEKELMRKSESHSPIRSDSGVGTPSPPRPLPTTRLDTQLPVIPLVPVLMDEKAKKELGFADENEFGATLV